MIASITEHDRFQLQKRTFDGKDYRIRREDFMAITGAHILLYSPEADKLRATLRDVFDWKHVDAGQGWLIFKLPPAEIGVHPAEGPGNDALMHQFSLMCDDVQATVRELRGKGIHIADEPQDHGWGIATTMVLPGGVKVQLYQPRHPVAVNLGG